ncbi:hypothetical protein EBR66_04160 [bacterium]|nr:hypothetical protein [bacterium]
MNFKALEQAGIDPRKDPVLAGIILGSLQMVTPVTGHRTIEGDVSRTSHVGADGAVERLSNALERMQ